MNYIDDDDRLTEYTHLGPVTIIIPVREDRSMPPATPKYSGRLVAFLVAVIAIIVLAHALVLYFG